MAVDIQTMFPSGIIPPLPVTEISKLTAKFVSQKDVDQVLLQLSKERPDIVISLIDREANGIGNIEDISHELYGYLKSSVFFSSNADFHPVISNRILFELRGRLYVLLGLPLDSESKNSNMESC